MLISQDRESIDPGKARVVEHWTSVRRADAIPRDLVIDPRGLGYMPHPNGVLVPYGHEVAAETPAREATPWPFGKPSGGGGGDATGPAISAMNPAPGATIGVAYTFSATVTDPSGVQSVSFKVQKGSGLAQSFAATQTSQDIWTVSLQGFTDGDWSWQVVAKDAAGKGGNSSSSSWVNFSVNTATGGAGGGKGAVTVTNAAWPGGGNVQMAAGRIYFDMPTNKRLTRWAGYVCSGTVASDGAADRSLIITAAHCVYDDANKAFARNVMFILDQDATSGSGTDLNCGNDPLGCWVPDFGVVDNNWTTMTFPNNVAWDYAFHVVPKSGAHTPGFLKNTSDDLEVAAGAMTVIFGAVVVDDKTTSGPTSPDFTAALGYSYSEAPNFMQCAEKMTTMEAVNWWLPSCGLSGGASGGPWLQPVSTGDGPIILVNSWGYTSRPGMAGPKLVGTSASCVFAQAQTRSPLELNNNLVANRP